MQDMWQHRSAERSSKKSRYRSYLIKDQWPKRILQEIWICIWWEKWLLYMFKYKNVEFYDNNEKRIQIIQIGYEIWRISVQRKLHKKQESCESGQPPFMGNLSWACRRNLAYNRVGRGLSGEKGNDRTSGCGPQEK